MKIKARTISLKSLMFFVVPICVLIGFLIATQLKFSHHKAELQSTNQYFSKRGFIGHHSKLDPTKIEVIKNGLVRKVSFDFSEKYLNSVREIHLDGVFVTKRNVDELQHFGNLSELHLCWCNYPSELENKAEFKIYTDDFCKIRYQHNKENAAQDE